MSDLLRNGYVNWVDGMRMSKTHLMQLQQAVEDRFRDIRSADSPLSDYGLLAHGAGGEPSLDMSVMLEGASRYRVELRQCRAVTAAGDRIELLAGQGPVSIAGEIPQQLAKEGNAFDVVLRTSPTMKAPYGVPDPDESPVRHPFLGTDCALEVIPTEDLRRDASSRNHLVIARLRVAGGQLEQDMGHIPPALCMGSLPQLEEFMREYARFLTDLERDLMRIVIKLNLINNQTELQLAVDALCRGGLRFLEAGLAYITFLGTSMRPREVVMHAAQLARTFYHATELRTGIGKDVLLDYIREHTGSGTADYSATVTSLMDMAYSPVDLRRALNAVSLFCRTHKKLFNLWVGLDYIGQKKNKDIFIAQDAGIHRSTTHRPAPNEQQNRPMPQAPPPPPPPQADDSGWDF